MATKTLEKFKSDFLNCQICMEDCVNPKLLDCLHFFCEGCLTKWRQNRRRIECPVCRQVTTLKSNCTSSLKSMFFVSSMIDAIKLKLKDGVECGDAGNVSRSSGKKIKFTDTRCRFHGERMNFYCKNCRKPVCRDCIVLDHPRPSHWCVNLSEAAANARVDIEKGIGEVAAMQAQLAAVEHTMKAREDEINESAAAAEAELKRMNNTLLKAIKTKRDHIWYKIEELSTSKKRALSAKKSEVATRNQTLSDLSGFLSSLQINGGDFDLAYGHVDVLKKIKEISAVEVPQVPEKPRRITFKPNTVCVSRLQGDFTTLGTVVDQKIDVQIDLRRPTNMPWDQQNFLIQTIRDAYVTLKDKPCATYEEYNDTTNKRLDYIKTRLDATYGAFWTCVIGDFRCMMLETNYLQVATVNDCEKIIVCKQPTMTHSINLSRFPVRIEQSSVDDALEARICRLVDRVLDTRTNSNLLCTELRKRLMQSLGGDWHVLFGSNFAADECFYHMAQIHVILQIGDEKLVIFQMNY